ncbi:MAG: hypothetical protein ACQERC_01710 [Bacteroidota bacterium]
MHVQNYILSIFLLLLCFSSSFSQFNLQAGYKLGFSDFESLSQGKMVHRFDILGEFKLKNNILLAVETGRHYYIIKQSSSEVTINSNTTTYHQSSFIEKRIANSLNLSVGYFFEINRKNAILTRLSVGMSSIPRVRTLEAYSEYRTVQNSDGSLVSYYREDWWNTNIKEMFNFPNSTVPPLNKPTLSVEYRYMLSDFFLNAVFDYSPYKPFILYANSGINHFFQFGFRIGYNFSKKEKSDE